MRGEAKAEAKASARRKQGATSEKGFSHSSQT